MPIRVLEADSVGILAARALGSPNDAVVLGRFERSFCLDVGGALITIGDDTLHDGPLNVRLGPMSGVSLTSDLGIQPGQRWTASPKRLRRRDGLEIDLGTASIWQPEKPNAAPERLQLKNGLDHLQSLIEERQIEGSGLSRLVIQRAPPRTATERAAHPHIEALNADLRHWLLDDAPPDPAPAIQLLGLGPGLTPSGDDLLAGLLITWHHLGAGLVADRLGCALLAAAVECTTPISQAHLAAAASGYGAAPLHHLLTAVVASRHFEVAETLDVVAKIGHSSGLDAIAGMMLALTAWLQADCDVPITA